MVKCNGFVTFVLLFFTGRNSGPIRTFNSSNDVIRLVHVPFGGLKPSNLILRGLRFLSGRNKPEVSFS